MLRDSPSSEGTRHIAPAPRVVVVTTRIPPEFSGAGFAAYKYAIRLHSRGELAFLLTRTAADLYLPGRSLSNDGSYELSENKLMRTAANHRAAARADRRSAGSAESSLSDVLRLLHVTIRVLVARRDEYDIVHCFSPNWLTGYAGIVAKLLGKRVILEATLLGSDDPATKYRADFLRAKWSFKRLQYSLADAISTISPALYAVCQDCGYPRHKVVMIPRSVDLQRFQPVSAVRKVGLRRELGIPAAGPMLLYVGGLNHRKGTDLLMPIYARIHERFPDAVLVTLGPNAGPEGKKLAGEMRATAAAIGADRNVFVMDPTTAVSAYMQAADLFLFPSRREGFGTVLIEAMACGIPAVALRIPGITEFIIDHGHDGIIVPRENPDDFAAACAELLTDRARYESIGRQARCKAAEFSDETADARYAELYARLLAGDESTASTH